MTLRKIKEKVDWDVLLIRNNICEKQQSYEVLILCCCFFGFSIAIKRK